MIDGRSSPLELRRAGLEALAKALGPVGMVRFMRQYESGSGDYSKDRYSLLGNADVATLTDEIERRRPVVAAD
jgi:hypothetical protein